MAFTSWTFLAFTALSLLLYFLLPARFRWMALLAVSYGFYFVGNGPATAWLLGVTALTYASGRLLGRLNRQRAALPAEQKAAGQARIRRKKRLVVLVQCLLCFGLLYILKYWNFTAELLGGLPRLDFLMPMAVSYFIFQAVGYVVDVYRGKTQAEQNPGKLALFLSFFPQMVQGPIGRFRQLEPQLTAGNPLDWEDMQTGVQTALWGYFKKLVIADRAAIAVNAVFGSSGSYGGAVIFSAVVLYSVQLYCDFSGGIDIARGVARMFGIRLAENFRNPYFATSLADYWRRWHITLGAWMRDYVFYPLSLSKPFGRLGRWSRKHLKGTLGKILPTSLATFLVYFIIGIWHGANLRYVAFGLWNGVLITAALLLEDRFRRLRQGLGIREKSRWYHGFRILRTFLLVLIGRYITRAPRLLVALSMLKTTMTQFRFHELLDGTFWTLGLSRWDLGVTLAGMALVLGLEWRLERGGDPRKTLAKQKGAVQWLVLFGFLLALLLLGIMRGDYIASEFIYTQF